MAGAKLRKVRPPLDPTGAGPQAVLYDGSEGVAREIRRRLAEKDLLADADNSLKIEIINSKGPEMVALTKKLQVV